MTKVQYLSELEAQIKVLPKDECESAIRFYTEYFDDAGVENEQQVIRQLGPVELLAKQLVNEARERSVPLLKHKNKGPLFWVLAVFASPFLVMFAAMGVMLAILVAAAGFMIVLAMAMIAVVPFIVCLSMLLAGAVTMVVGLLVMFQSFPTMLWFSGVGLAAFSLGMLIFNPCYNIMQYSMGAVFKFSGWLMRKVRQIGIRKDRYMGGRKGNEK